MQVLTKTLCQLCTIVVKTFMQLLNVLADTHFAVYKPMSPTSLNQIEVINEKSNQTRAFNNVYQRKPHHQLSHCPLD